MSPEQATGGTDLDGRSDLYALGCVLYEMLSGETPYTGSTPEAILAKKLSEPVPRVSVVRDTVPAVVEAALTRALARLPADRYPTAAQLAKALTGPFTPGAATAAGVGRRRTRFAVAFAVIVAIAAAGWLAMHMVRRAGPTGIRSLAVLPPQDHSGDSTQAYFVLGVFDGLIGELDQIAALRVISRTSTMPYQGTRKPVPQIARELNVDAVVESSVLRVGDSVHLRVELVRARPVEQNLGGRRYDRDVKGVLKLYGDVAQDIARTTGASLTADQAAHLANPRQVDPATYEAYVKAAYYLDKGTPEGSARAVALLHEAIARDPGDPLAWAKLALTYTIAACGPTPPTDALPLARASAERALKLDSTLTEAMAGLAYVKGYLDWDWETADRMFRRTLELNPSLSDAHYSYSWQLALFDRLNEAVAEHKRAREVDPLNPLNTAWLGLLYVMERRFDDALDEAHRSLALDSAFAPGYLVIADVHIEKGEYEEALPAARQAASVDPSWMWFLGRAYALAGRRGEAQTILAQLEAERPTPWGAFGLAVLHGALGNTDQAFRWLNYEHPHVWVAWVRVLPWFRPLWGDARFAALLRKMHLPPRTGTA
jgi:TolB-like protein